MIANEICTAGRWRLITDKEVDEIVASTNRAYVRDYSCARVPFLEVQWDVLFERTIAAAGIVYAPQGGWVTWEPVL